MHKNRCNIIATLEVVHFDFRTEGPICHWHTWKCGQTAFLHFEVAKSIEPENLDQGYLKTSTNLVCFFLLVGHKVMSKTPQW